MRFSKYELMPWQKLNLEKLPDDLILIAYEWEDHICYDLGSFVHQALDEDSIRWDGTREVDESNIIAYTHLFEPAKDYRLEPDIEEGE